MDYTASINASLTNPKLALETVSKATGDHFVIKYLDAGEIEKARAFLELKEDGNILALDSLSPFSQPDTAKAACRLMKAISARRAKHTEKPPSTSPEIDEAVKAALKNQSACNDEHSK